MKSFRVSQYHGVDKLMPRPRPFTKHLTVSPLFITTIPSDKQHGSSRDHPSSANTLHSLARNSQSSKKG
ncbi:Uncharacterized protein HZ326_12732 [Fusarium oxysporum f. sp. albedinis]|nr:Uncharacterized protein HZ326_12732 [Fusarium oxysporum f. sp. albedinis]